MNIGILRELERKGSGELKCMNLREWLGNLALRNEAWTAVNPNVDLTSVDNKSMHS
jgi:hypothetical protein